MKPILAILFNILIIFILYIMAAWFHVAFFYPLLDVFDENIASICMFIGILMALTAFSFVHSCMFGWGGSIANLIVGGLLTIFGAVAYSYGYGHALITVAILGLGYVSTGISKYYSKLIGGISCLVFVFILGAGFGIKDNDMAMKPKELTPEERLISLYSNKSVEWDFTIDYCDENNNYQTEYLTITSNYQDMKTAIELKSQELIDNGSRICRVVYAPQDSI